MFLSEKRKIEIQTLLWDLEPGSDLYDAYRYGLASGYREGVIDANKDIKDQKEFSHFDACK